jgi:predicted DNA-binding transcriptional regulator YafY
MNRHEPKVIWEGKHVGSAGLMAGEEIRIYDRGAVRLLGTCGTWREAVGSREILAAELAGRFRIFDRQIRRMLRQIAEQRSVLKELVSLIDDPDYTPDSFTTQPARALLEANTR